jgi:RNA-binding signal recognition particle 68
MKLSSALERNLLQAKTLGKKILQAGESVFIGGAQTSQAQYHKLKSDLRPQNVVRFYEKALKA